MRHGFGSRGRWFKSSHLVYYLSSQIVLKPPVSPKRKILTTPDKQVNAPGFPGAFYAHLFLRVFPSWEPLMDHENSAIQVFLFFNFMRFPLNGQVDQRLA